jgi:hypothetical protein
MLEWRVFLMRATTNSAPDPPFSTHERQPKSGIPCLIESTSFGLIITCSIQEICITMSPLTFWLQIYDISNIHCAFVENERYLAIFGSKTNATQ